jgi:hypothetical protein
VSSQGAVLKCLERMRRDSPHLHKDAMSMVNHREFVAGKHTLQG